MTVATRPLFPNYIPAIQLGGLTFCFLSCCGAVLIVCGEISIGAVFTSLEYIIDKTRLAIYRSRLRAYNRTWDQEVPETQPGNTSYSNTDSGAPQTLDIKQITTPFSNYTHQQVTDFLDDLSLCINTDRLFRYLCTRLYDHTKPIPELDNWLINTFFSVLNADSNANRFNPSYEELTRLNSLLVEWNKAHSDEPLNYDHQLDLYQLRFAPFSLSAKLTVLFPSICSLIIAYKDLLRGPYSEYLDPIWTHSTLWLGTFASALFTRLTTNDDPDKTREFTLRSATAMFINMLPQS